MDNHRKLLKKLSVTLQKSGKKSVSFPKRLHNIKWIADLERENLRYGIREVSLLMYTLSDAKLYIQYPGKESVANPKKRDSSRPWDFRPKLLNTTTEEPSRDLSFTDINESLENSIRTISTSNKDILRILSLILYRMAFMIDHEQTEDTKLQCQVISNDSAGETYEKEFSIPHYVYRPDAETIDSIATHIPKLCNIPLLQFIHYLDLLVWNEDCKYYYRALKKKGMEPNDFSVRVRKLPWINNIGRVNTLLSLINFIGVLTGDVRLSSLFAKFSRFGVSGISDEDIKKLSGGYIK